MRYLVVIAVGSMTLAGCGRASPPLRHQPRARALTPLATAVDSAATAASAQAADFLRAYYRRIESRDYGAAWQMQGAGRVDEARFAANFSAYRDYHALVGLASGPVAKGGWIYVEVPVMITGRFVTGKAFGTAGRVLVLRPDRAGAVWTIYPG